MFNHSFKEIIVNIFVFILAFSIVFLSTVLVWTPVRVIAETFARVFG